MEMKTASNFWWVKEMVSDTNVQDTSDPEITNSFAEFLEKERDLECLDELTNDEEVDIGSILEEITRLSAKSPLGPYEKDTGDRSIDDIMREVEKIYLESSKSFEQLSHRSKTSQNITEIVSTDESTPTPKSLSPLPLDEEKQNKPEDIEKHPMVIGSIFKTVDTVSETNKKEIEDTSGLCNVIHNDDSIENKIKIISDIRITPIQRSVELVDTSKSSSSSTEVSVINEVLNVDVQEDADAYNKESALTANFKEEIVKKDEVIKLLIVDNRGLKQEIKTLEEQIIQMRQVLEETTATFKAQSKKSPEVNIYLENALEELKDTKEINTALQLQLDEINKTHQIMKTNYEDVLNSNKHLERRLVDIDTVLAKYKQELQNAQQQKDKLLENEVNLNRLLDVERSQVKNLKQQIEKDTKCIMDLNRQIKEMERIITRKHPDSVSALIVAAKTDAIDNTSSTKRLLEDRIKALEKEAFMRDAQSSQVFIDVQEKFNQMKLKYESHIEDLELHVNDLKSQLKRRVDTYDVYTQTIKEDQTFPEKDTSNVYVQTDNIKFNSSFKINKKPEREPKEETHLIATIRGFQADLTNREKVIVKLQREVDELKKTNRRLQKEREGSLKNLTDKKEYKSIPEKLSSLATNIGSPILDSDILQEELRAVKIERDKMKSQLCRIEEDYQNLKAKRLQDLNTLQEAHEREMSTYLTNITPLREQLEVQQVTISNLQQQLISTKEQLAIVSVERDHLNNKIECGIGHFPDNLNGNDDTEVITLKRKLAHLERKYEERENRLRAIVHGLAQKTVTNRNCEQCAARQQQLIGYKAELDQILSTLRCLQ